MTRSTVWNSIAATLGQEIAAGHYPEGTKLPTEAELSARFGVNRHTVRRALTDMAERGLVRSRRGSGVYVETAPTDYPLGRRVRFHQNIRASGRTPTRKMLRLEQRPCDATEAEALDLSPTDPVLVCEGLSLSSHTPVAQFVSVFPITRLEGLQEALAEIPSVTEALRRIGVQDYVRRDTRVTAELADAGQAALLGIREGAPILRTVGLNTTLDGVPIERGITCFVGDRVALMLAND
ncbi:phosphonate metabolism transcriptional regulator PhnF [Donghicola eburneus]|uniref:phosphonate metabolism transcriptional regulator PhnF n=1 Tax=Donghicola eburneus TaxID=393278 RepID=UPI0008E91279|nr:phosphonate metabolism transcriptional regulator PhnF [Donghicola eburneus]SFQ78507.1 transcriptional regulator, GntR family [Donghicola eburneus]